MQHATYNTLDNRTLDKYNRFRLPPPIRYLYRTHTVCRVARFKWRLLFFLLSPHLSYVEDALAGVETGHGDPSVLGKKVKKLRKRRKKFLGSIQSDDNEEMLIFPTLSLIPWCTSCCPRIRGSHRAGAARTPVKRGPMRTQQQDTADITQTNENTTRGYTVADITRTNENTTTGYSECNADQKEHNNRI